MLDKDWKTERLADMESGREVTHTTAYKIASQFLILALTARNIPFRVINLGSGIKTITTRIDDCGGCYGTGKC